MPYRGLILDFGGVVTTDFYGALSAFCVREGLPADAIIRAFQTPEGSQALAAAETGRVTQAEWEKTLGRLLGVNDNQLVHRVLADLRPRPGIHDLVRDARKAGIATAILSNSWGSGDYDPYAGYDLEEDYDAIVISDQVGLRKPGHDIYRLTAEKLGLPPAECLFVDDSAHNLPAAAELGMGTVHFTGPEEIQVIRGLLGL
jgi:epoxide hydrolase-like predicted phosphatase